LERGCVPDEEAYSLAMIFAVAMEPAAFRDRVRSTATDVDQRPRRQRF
jgi:chemotaxis methyl-accepting protein methylase